MPATEHIRNKLSQLPHKPGIYLMKDRFGTVIYVGKARDLRKRVSQYFHPSRRHGWDLKLNALVEAVHDFDVHTVRSEPEALLLEGRLIKEFQPRYNISFRDDKRFLMLKVNLNDPIPRFTLTRLKQDDGALYYGPFADSSALRGTLTLARKKFNLRGCSPLTPTGHDYKHCLYGNLKFCTAPCVGNVSHGEYKLQVRAACEFLAGQTGEMEQQLEEEMRRAAGAQDYEKAAQYRDALADLRATTRKTTRFERTPWNLPVAISPDDDNARLAGALGLSGPPVRIEGFDISNISGTLKVASVVAFRNGRPDRANYRRMRIQSVEGQDDFACMAEAVRRRYARLLREGGKQNSTPATRNSKSKTNNPEAPRERDELDRAIPDELRTMVKEVLRARHSTPSTSGETTCSGVDESDPSGDEPEVDAPSPLPPREGAGAGARTGSTALELPDLIVIDGGKGQLNAALDELAKLGLSGIPVIGLAKEFEEIYRPGQPDPLRLERDDSALKLLQRIRDESHRVANSYNAQLRLKKISESLLDEFPGIGDRRKTALLKRFGSIQRLRAASVEQIAEVPGFGGRSAADLKAFLEARSSTHPETKETP
jgi:excinuclease ABC subunit C